MNLIRHELLKVGIMVNNIYDLVNTNDSYPEAIPVLLSLLKSKSIDNLKDREGIVRSLAVKEAISKAGEVLIDEYNNVPVENNFYRWAIGNTMSVVITKEDLDPVWKIVLNKKNGMSRQMFVMALGKVKSKRSEDILIDLLDDDEVALHALNALGRLKSTKAIDKVKFLISHPKTVVRKEAAKALKKIER